MWKIKKIYTKTSKSDQGFTLLEVLVAMLIATFFVLGSMQALVLATALRVKAQEKQRANQLIQEATEQIQFEAKDLAIDHSLCTATAYNGSYAQNLWTNRPSLPANKQLLDGQGKTYRLTWTADTTNSTAKVLKINFAVQTVEATPKTIATDYIEVIPNAAIQCPN